MAALAPPRRRRRDRDVTRRVVVVGGGIAGLTVAERLAATAGDDVDVELREARRPRRRQAAHVAVRRPRRRRRGRRRLPRAGAARRRPGAARRSRPTLTAPVTGHAAIWHGRPAGASRTGCCSACPATSSRLARSRLLSVGGTLRAAVEPLLPAHGATPTTRSARSSAPASATRSTSDSSTRSSAASTPPTPTASAWRWCRSSPPSPTVSAACCWRRGAARRNGAGRRAVRCS